jgi:hypothetical protein
VLYVLHDFVSRANPNDSTAGYDNYASGRNACFISLEKLCIQAIAVNFVHNISREPTEMVGVLEKFFILAPPAFLQYLQSAQLGQRMRRDERA